MLAPVVVVVLLAGIPGNVDALLQQRRADRSLQREYRKLMLTMPRMPVAHEVPRSTRPEQRFAKGVTLGWLLDGVASGRIPKPERITPVDAATASLYVALNAQPMVYFPAPCSNVLTPVRVRLSASQVIRITGEVRVVSVTPAGVKSRPVTYEAEQAVVTNAGIAPRAPRLVALAGPLTLEVDPVDPQQPVAVCVPDGTLIPGAASSPD